MYSQPGMYTMSPQMIAAVGVGCNVTSSSKYDDNHSVEGIVLNQVRTGGLASSWCAKENNVNQWVKIYFGGNDFYVHKISIQGRHEFQQWVTKFGLEYTVDGIRWEKVHDGNPAAYHIFAGNNDCTTVVEQNIYPVVAKAVKIVPLEWHGHISMRCEVFITKH
ncbi:hypothetical protein NAEGRDRAFT_74044 [Naegleria gruberi]|uniref:Uncharacterized protein AM18 n=1 Tax=Naegleria gruberi TaxID=5762 RepID=D2VYA0_NAEGR|nr:uncharacterized protein NAEGRDRAFT_74044 [Naegleria gruberi]EFC38165.1 hypothetical protein NAEGRDRAFT_74044 [Naegleria gruberi]|eukprot:XP_002670909.1 hypothetical protein NAEGRDRAFT_74044 [Naegleria gruberi strain NEG-M]